jgi:hypothetical protein
MMRSFLLTLLALTTLHAGEKVHHVLCYNVRQDTRGDTGPRDWPNRKALLTGYLLESKASIIGLQEVRHNQLQDIDRAIPDHDPLGVGREDGKTRGEYSPIFYDRTAWKPDPAEQGTFWLSDTPTVPNSMSWGNKVTRICTWARLISITGSHKGSTFTTPTGITSANPPGNSRPN